MATYNGERTLNSCLEHLFNQDYPKNSFELIIMEGGSDDETLNIIDKYKNKGLRILLYPNLGKRKEGKGMGMDLGTKKAKGDLLFFMDQDNLLIQKGCLSNLVNIIEKNKKLSAVQAQTIIPKKSTIIDKYLGAIGIEDPFAIPYSLKSQIILNPKKFKYIKTENYYVYEVNKNNFYYAGNNGYLTRKKDFFESGGYTQDIDNFYRMATSKRKYNIAVAKNIKIYHKTSDELVHFLKKRNFYIRSYLLKNYENRDFYWINLKKNNFKQNFKFLNTILFNLLIIPGLFQGIRVAVRQRKWFWLIHPVMLFFITLEYIYSFFYAKIFKKENASKI